MNKKTAVLFTALAVSLLSGCVPRAETPSSQAQAASRTEAVSSRTPASSAVSDAWMSRDGQISLEGENKRCQLKNLSFSDDSTGWVIAVRYGPDGTERTRLLTTRDGGESWAFVGEDDVSLQAVRFTGKTEGWAVAAEESASTAPDGQAQAKYRIMRTADGGKSWETRWQGGAVPEEGSALYFDGPRNGWALAGNALLRTKNGGKTWSAVSFGISGFRPQKICFITASDGWAAGTDEKKQTLYVLHTADGGKRWNIRFHKKYDEGAAGCAGIDFLNAKEGWFLTTDLSAWTGELYHTANGGSSWETAGTVKSVRPTPEGIDFIDSRTGWIPFDVGAGPVAGGIAVTRDGGKSFEVLGSTGAENSETTQKVSSARQVLFLSDRNGWVVGSDRNRGDFLLHTQDGGTTWKQMFPNEEPTLDFTFVDAEKGFGLGKLSDPNALLKTTDGGRSWQEIYSFAGSWQVEKISFVNPREGWVLALPAGTASGSAQTLLHTSDGGETWSKPKSAAGAPPDFNDADDLPFRMPASASGWSSRAMASLSGRKGMILAESQDVPGAIELLTTVDGGKTWSIQSFPQGSEGTLEFLQEQAPMRFTDDAHGWLLTAYGLLRTTDGGRTWSWQ